MGLLGRSLLWLATGAALLAGCVAPTNTACDDGVVCGAGQVCAPAGGGCVDPAQVDACAGTAAGAACELAGIGAGLCRAGVCVVAGCGDGVLDAGEACDDGNLIDDDACTTACARPTCGDGGVQGDEACDDGAANGDDRACTTRCLAAACGDNLVLAGIEACDAGAANADDDACTTACVRAACGDGHVFAGVEACDDGNAASGDGCRADCGKAEACGDAVVDAAEACDDGNGNAADGCDACVATAWRAEAILGAGAVAAGAVGLARPSGVAVDRLDNLYVVDTANHRVRRVDAATGAISTVAGTGVAGAGGDGGLANTAQLYSPTGIAVDGLGNVFIADTDNQRVRRVDGVTATITTVAGTGGYGFGGDGGAASGALLARPQGVAVDGLGNVYVADAYNQRIRRVAVDTGVITTVAGTGVQGYAGDGAAATDAHLAFPAAVAVDAHGDLLIADRYNHCIRRIDVATGIITTFAGTGTAGFAGDGGAATSASLASPYGVAVDGAGAVYVADRDNHRVRRVDPVTGFITTLVGTGPSGCCGGFSGDGAEAILARLSSPLGVVPDGHGRVHVSDQHNHRIRTVDLSTGLIATTAGVGTMGFRGDGGAAQSTSLGSPQGVVVDAALNVYVADTANHLVRRIDGVSGVITTVAGTGGAGASGDGGPALSAQLTRPQGLALDAQGRVYIADTHNHRIRRLDPLDGVITTVVGTGEAGFAGDGGVAVDARLANPTGVSVDALGNLYVADTDNHRIRRVDGLTGSISTVVGTGTAGAGGDGGPAINALLRGPAGLALDGDGNLYVADTNNNRVRRIAAATGTITTVAGTGVRGFAGDDGPATGAQLAAPRGVAVDGHGDLIIADTGNGRLRRVDAGTGRITTVAGAGLGGDGGAASGAILSWAETVAVDAADNLYVGQPTQVRRIDRVSGIITTVAGQVAPEGMGPLGQARLALPEALVLTSAFTLFAGGETGTVQAARGDVLEVVAGRYLGNPQATADLARYRASSFGTVGGVAYDAAAGVIYLAETSANRLHVVTVVEPDDPESWNIATLAGDAAGAVGAPGFADGAALTARFRAPRGLAFDDTARLLYVADSGNHVVRTLDVDAGQVGTLVGTPATLGFFGDGGAADVALLHAPSAVTRCAATGDLFIADAGNHRIRRVAAGTDVISTVLGDGVAASSGQGAPATAFPVDDPRAVACDAAGNLYVTSTTTVRLLPAAIAPGEATGVVDGSGAVQTVYGAPPRDALPASLTACLTGLAVVDAATLQVTDACTGLLVELWRQPAGP